MIKLLPFLKQPQSDYHVYLSGIITFDSYSNDKFNHAERICCSEYGFIYIFNPYKFCQNRLSIDIRTWENCMKLDTLILDSLDKKYAIFLRIDPIEKACEVKSGMLIENYLAIQNGFIICDLIGDEIKLAENDNRFLRSIK